MGLAKTDSKIWRILISSACLLSCTSSGPLGPRDIDWKREWVKNEPNLKTLVNDIKTKNNNKYTSGNNEFPADFSYPFEQGFFIESRQDQFDPNNMLIKFYVDRGLLDHFSAIIFCNDSARIKKLDENVANGGNDFQLEPNWDMIND